MTSAPEQQARRIRVLVVDDDDSIRKLVARVFTRRGYDVETASDGADAIEMLDSSDFDLLMLDLMMPRVDGIAVIEHMGNSSKTMPAVIVMTAAVPTIVGRLPLTNVARVLTKPFDLEHLLRDADEALGLVAAATPLSS